MHLIVGLVLTLHMFRLLYLRSCLRMIFVRLCLCSVSFQVGCDRSSALIQICVERGFQAFVSDALSVPLRTEIGRAHV